MSDQNSSAMNPKSKLYKSDNKILSSPLVLERLFDMSKIHRPASCASDYD